MHIRDKAKKWITMNNNPFVQVFPQQLTCLLQGFWKILDDDEISDHNIQWGNMRHKQCFLLAVPHRVIKCCHVVSSYLKFQSSRVSPREIVTILLQSQYLWELDSYASKLVIVYCVCAGFYTLRSTAFSTQWLSFTERYGPTFNTYTVCHLYTDYGSVSDILRHVTRNFIGKSFNWIHIHYLVVLHWQQSLERFFCPSFIWCKHSWC